MAMVGPPNNLTDLRAASTARLKARFGLDTRLAPVQARPAATDERPAVLFRFSPILAFIFIPGNNPSTKTAAGP